MRSSPAPARGCPQPGSRSAKSSPLFHGIDQPVLPHGRESEHRDQAGIAEDEDPGDARAGHGEHAEAVRRGCRRRRA